MSQAHARPYLADNPHVGNQIADRGLCVRCGACEPACPVDIIRFDDRALPYVVDESRCPQGCQRCLKVCPGEDLDLARLDGEHFGLQPDPRSITGIARGAYVGHALDPQLREGAASGGVVSQLLVYLLEKGHIDGALVLGSQADADGVSLKPVVARSPEEIRQAASSKYIAVPFLRELREIEEVEGRYAVVALPCFVHALRKYQRSSKKLRERISLVIGIFCNVVFDPILFEDLFSFSGIPRSDVTRIDFRDGAWPGVMSAQRRSGEAQRMLRFEEFRDAFNVLKWFYAPARCNMCTDYSAEYADIAVGDPWLRGEDGRFLYPDSRSSVLVRTPEGAEALSRAQADGYLELNPIPLETFQVNFEKHASYKRDFVPLNIETRRRLGLPAPRYGRLMGRAKRGAFASMLLRNTVLWLARFRWFRRLGVALAQTPPALAYLRWNRTRKERRFAASYRRMEAFVASLATQQLTEAAATSRRARSPEP